jgi:hypothetical protein
MVSAFTLTEVESGVVPFDIGTAGLDFTKTFMFLVDGIYPSYSRFIRGRFKEPVTEKERSTFTASWQEGARKDVERAFGVLQCKYKAVATPIHTIEHKYIASMVSCCLILHNMGVEDRVMGGVGKRYDPGAVAPHEEDEEAPTTLPEEEQQECADGGVHPPPVEVAATTTIRAFDLLNWQR